MAHKITLSPAGSGMREGPLGGRRKTILKNGSFRTVKENRATQHRIEEEDRGAVEP